MVVGKKDPEFDKRMEEIAKDSEGTWPCQSCNHDRRDHKSKSPGAKCKKCTKCTGYDKKMMRIRSTM